MKKIYGFLGSLWGFQGLLTSLGVGVVVFFLKAVQFIDSVTFPVTADDCDSPVVHFGDTYIVSGTSDFLDALALMAYFLIGEALLPPLIRRLDPSPWECNYRSSGYEFYVTIT